MAKIMDIGGQSVAFGMSWRVLDGIESEKAELAGLVSELGTQFHTLAKRGSEAICGFLPKEDIPKKDKSPIYSGAAAFAAQIEGNALLLYQFDNECVMVAVKNGLPLQGQDRVGDKQEILIASREFLQSFHDDIEVYGNLDAESPDCKPYDLDSLELSKEYLVTKFRQQLLSNQMIGVLLIGALGAGYLWYEDHQKAEQLKQAQAHQVDPNVLYQQTLTAELSKIGPRVSEIESVWWHDIRTIPMIVSGWKLNLVSCANGTPCQVQWTTIDPWLVSHDGLEPLSKEVSYSADAHNAVYALTPERQADRDTKKSPLDASSIQQDIMIKTQLLGLVSQIRALGGEFQYQQPTTFALPPGVDESQITNTVKYGDWSFTGRAWLIDLLKEATPDTFRVDSLELSASGREPNLTIKGHYYVR